MTLYAVSAEDGTLRVGQRVRVRGIREGQVLWGVVDRVMDGGKNGIAVVDDRPRWARRKANHKSHNLATKLKQKEKQDVRTTE